MEKRFHTALIVLMGTSLMSLETVRAVDKLTLDAPAAILMGMIEIVMMGTGVMFTAIAVKVISIMIVEMNGAILVQVSTTMAASHAMTPNVSRRK